MGKKQGSDQAEGLRRLFATKELRVVSFIAAAPGVGKTALLVNLAVCLARHGQEILVVDENAGEDNDVAGTFGLKSSHDLWDVINGKASLADAVLSPVPGVRVLPAAKAVNNLGRLSLAQREAMQGSFARPVDLLLVDAAYQHTLGYSPLGIAADEKVLVLKEDEGSIGATYALVRHLSHTFGRKRFRLLVNQTRSEHSATRISESLSSLIATEKLGRMLSVTQIPFDPAWVAAASQSLPLVTTHPGSPAALVIREMAHDLLHWPGATQNRGGLMQFIETLLGATERVSPLPQVPVHVQR